MAEPLHIFIFCSTTVPNKFAHPIQILKTVRALASRPGVRVTLYFVTLTAKRWRIWKYYGLEPMDNVEIKGMVPRWYYRLRRMNNNISLRHYNIYRLVRRRVGRELEAAARQAKTIIYTRNENVVELLHPIAAEAGIPIYLELHWLKYVDRFRKFIESRKDAEQPPPPLSECKAFLRGKKTAEEEVLRKTDGILCLTGQIRKVLEQWDVGVPLGCLPSGVDFVETRQWAAQAAQHAESESDEWENETMDDDGEDDDFSNDDDNRLQPDRARDRTPLTMQRPATGDDEAPSSSLSGPNGPDANGAITPPQAIDVLYVGQLYPWKGVDLLIHAMALIEPYRLTIVGGNRSKDKQRIRDLIGDYDMSERVRMVGHVNHPKVRRYIRKARVCVIPLPRRGFREARIFTSPMKLFEFAAFGKPIVASDLPTLREVLEHGRNAWLTEPDNPQALAQGLRTLLEDDALSERLAAGALELAEQHDYAHRARRILEFCGVAENARS